MLVSDVVPVIDISIVTFNSSQWIDGFFDSLDRQNYPVECINVLVTDNGSTDDSVEKLRTIGSRSRYGSFQVFESTNRGFGHGHNNNIQAGSSGFILAANIDLIFEHDSITEIVSLASRDDGRVAAWEMRQKPHEHPKYYDPVTLETSWSSSACTLFRRQAIEAVGGYDDVFFMYGEDVDLSWRMRAKGYVLKYCPSATCWHYTYAESKFKKIQFLGSLLGNLYLRNRFGSRTDVEEGEANYLAVMNADGQHYPGQRQDLASHFDTYLANRGHFQTTDPVTRQQYRQVAKFPDAWDYEVARDGAFHDLGALPDAQPLVSIIVRTYAGRDALLADALASIRNQTYRNFEVIVVEDGGASTQHIVEALRDPRFRHIACPKVGRCATGNTGLAAAHGEYFGFLDDDDLFFADHLEVNVAALLNDKSGRARVAYTSAFEIQSEIGRDGQGYFRLLREAERPTIYAHPFSRVEILWRNILPIQAAVFHRSLYDELGGFDTALDNLEDWNLWTRYACGSTFIYIEKTTSIFRTPVDRAAASAREELMLAYYDVALQKQDRMCLENVMAAELREDIRPLKDLVHRLNGDIDHLRKHIDEIGAIHAENVARHKAALAETQEGLSRLQREYAAVVNSRTWRLMVPFIRAAKWLKAVAGSRHS